MQVQTLLKQASQLASELSPSLPVSLAKLRRNPRPTRPRKRRVKQRKAAVRDHIHNSRYGEENDEDSEESGFEE
jgi:hypothetical protein